MLIFSDFDVEEQNIVNSAIQNEDLNAYRREHLLEQLDYVISFSGDMEVAGLYERTREKIAALDEKDWKELLSSLPFKTPYSSDSAEYPEE